jgi:hypothetical protein
MRKMVFSKTLTHVERNDGIPPDIVGQGSRKENRSTRPGAEPVFFSLISLSQETNSFWHSSSTIE